LSNTLNFTKSANEAFLTQPSFSRQISLLEEEVGVDLFFRDKHSVKLTPAGNAFLEPAKKILKEYQKGINDARSAVAAIAGQIRIGFFPETTGGFLPNFIKLFREKYPGIKPVLIGYRDTKEEDDLYNNAIDIAFFTPFFNKAFNDEISYRCITANDFPCVITSKHSWLTGHDTIKFSKLSDESFIILDPKISYYNANDIIKMCRQYGFEPKIGEMANGITELLTLVACGEGISIMPGNFRAFNREHLHIIKIEEKMEPVSFIYIWKTNNSNPHLQYFLNELANYIEKYLDKSSIE
jgi:DNA-binding transcriptional LysR family regulator